MSLDANTLAEMVAAANTRFTDPERNRIIREKPGEKPRFELYHFFMSMCSYKARAVLDEKDASYISHDINIIPPVIENYYPEYVRLRLKGRELLSGEFCGGYTGRSSTDTEGFDPCVVPTLVDHEATKVLVNSKLMCLYLERELDTGTTLIPKGLEVPIERQLDAVDQTPHPAVFYGGNPEGDERPEFLREVMKTAHDVKIAKLEENMALVGSDEPELVSAYRHKIIKERAGKAFVRDKASMDATLAEFKQILATLETDLEATGGEWLFGDQFTMADLFWATSLFRLKWLGFGYIWDDGDKPALPLLSSYSRRLFARPSIDRTTIHWPMLPPSKHTMEYYPDAA